MISTPVARLISCGTIYGYLPLRVAFELTILSDEPFGLRQLRRGKVKGFSLLALFQSGKIL